MKMPDWMRDLYEWLSQIPPPLQSFFAAVIITPLRIYYDRSESSGQRIFLEALLCGCISYGLASGAQYFNVPDGVSVFIGSAVGFYGALKIKELGLRFLRTKVPE